MKFFCKLLVVVVMRFCLFVIVFCCLISLRRVVFFSTVLVRIFPFLFYFCSVLHFCCLSVIYSLQRNLQITIYCYLIFLSFFFLSVFSVVVKRSKVFFPLPGQQSTKIPTSDPFYSLFLIKHRFLRI
jgi:hypothetical protein